MQTIKCESCEILYINGIRCHELGCPDAWADYEVECHSCGTDFKPEHRDQVLCDDECAKMYYN